MSDAVFKASIAAIHGIVRERQRQIEEEGYSPEHDDAHDGEELAMAAVFYLIAGITAERDGCALSSIVNHELPGGIHWAWDKEFWKPSDDPIRNLDKAGALIIAESERLRRLKMKTQNET